MITELKPNSQITGNPLPNLSFQDNIKQAPHFVFPALFEMQLKPKLMIINPALFLGLLVSYEDLPLPSLANASTCAQRSPLVQKEEYNWKSVYKVSTTGNPSTK